jgi:protein kinase-like protein/GAF domain-containing protein
VVAYSSATLAPGTRVGDYEIETPLGAREVATVYRARARVTGTPVVLKRPLSSGDVARWEIEARLLAELEHPGVVRLVDHFEEPAGIYNIVMALVDGGDLARRLWDRGSPGLPPSDVLGWTLEMCAALQYLHDQQVVHGDIKPRNIVAGRDGARLVDFGLAERVDRTERAVARGGTPQFMAPEVFAGRAASPRSDVFSLAATAWTLITGSPPAYGEDRSRAGVAAMSDELALALRSALAFRAEDRTASAGDLARCLGAEIDARTGTSLAASDPALGERSGLFESIARAAAGVFEAAATSIALIDAVPGTGGLKYVAAWGAGASEIVGFEIERGRGLAGAAAVTGAAQVVPHCRSDPRFAAAIAAQTGYVPHTMLALPVRRGGVTIGVLSMLDRRGGAPYGLDDLPRAELFADVVAASVDQHRPGLTDG